MKNLLLSAAIGDIGGQPYEFKERTKDYNAVDLTRSDNNYTDDTVCTFACAEALLFGYDVGEMLRKRGKEESKNRRGFGGMFFTWITSEHLLPPYYSFGNGSAMRVSAAGWMARSVEECVALATRTAVPTHNHPEGIKGAVSTALAIFYLRNGYKKSKLRDLVNKYYPEWKDKKYNDIKPDYKFDVSCQGTVPAAMLCVIESKDYEDCIKLAISLGGDADTLGAIAGPIAYAYYKEMPEELIDNAKKKLPSWMIDINDEVDHEYGNI